MKKTLFLCFIAFILSAGAAHSYRQTNHRFFESASEVIAISSVFVFCGTLEEMRKGKDDQ